MPVKRDIELTPRKPVAVNKSDGRVQAGWEPQQYQATATCRTKGCAVEGVPFHLTLFTNADGIERVLCARCDQWVEDITDE